jgi:hypothetical protein
MVFSQNYNKNAAASSTPIALTHRSLKNEDYNKWKGNSRPGVYNNP